ncbi:MAG: DUF4388 domain-containing protein [Candidatus Mariimomonas ferrooxydans]
MMHGEKRKFRRYKCNSPCEIKLDKETFKGTLVDYAEGVNIVTENIQQLVPGVKVIIDAPEMNMVFDAEIVWIRESDDNRKLGLKRLESFKGSLREFHLPEILIGYQRSPKTGILEVTGGSIVKKIYIKNGDMIFSASNHEDDRLGALLLKKGWITFEQYRQASALLKQTGERFGNILVELGYLTSKELSVAVQHQIEEIIISLFTVEEGTFEFSEGPLPSDEVITLRISAANIIYQGIKKINNFEYIEKICPPLDAVLNLSSNPINIFQDIAVTYPDKKILSLVNGQYPLKTILSLSPSSDFETLKTIHAFLSTGLINVKREDEAPVEFPVEELIGEPVEPITIEFMEKIDEMFNKCETAGYYEFLGIEKGISIDELIDIYYNLSKQFHPDRHFSQPSEDLKMKLIKIFSYATAAFETLSNAEKRKEYDSMMLALDAKASEKEAEETVPGLTRDEHAEELQDEAAHADTVHATSSGDAVKEEQETDELTAGVVNDAVATHESDSAVDEIIDSQETAEKEKTEDMEPAAAALEKPGDEEAQLDTDKTTTDDVFAEEDEEVREKKKSLFSPVAIVVAIALVIASFLIYKNFKKEPQSQTPVITTEVSQHPAIRDENISHVQKSSLPAFRDDAISKVLNESSSQK